MKKEYIKVLKPLVEAADDCPFLKTNSMGVYFDIGVVSEDDPILTRMCYDGLLDKTHWTEERKVYLLTHDGYEFFENYPRPEYVVFMFSKWSYDEETHILMYEEYDANNPDWGGVDKIIKTVVHSMLYGDLDVGGLFHVEPFDNWVSGLGNRVLEHVFLLGGSKVDEDYFNGKVLKSLTK